MRMPKGIREIPTTDENSQWWKPEAEAVFQQAGKDLVKHGYSRAEAVELLTRLFNACELEISGE